MITRAVCALRGHIFTSGKCARCKKTICEVNGHSFKEELDENTGKWDSCAVCGMDVWRPPGGVKKAKPFTPEPITVDERKKN